MGLRTPISRITEYYIRRGFGATIRRAGLALRRGLFANRMVVFYCDLSRQSLPEIALPASLEVNRINCEAELGRQDLEAIVAAWNPKLALRNVKERFAKSASLWLIKSGKQVAGYCWTLRGKTIAPYYFPMASDDVQLFDFYVFPKFRGRAILWFLISSMLHALKAEGGVRAFGDAAEWNQASLSFYKMIPFRRLGVVRSFNIFGSRFTSWAEGKNPEQVQQLKESRDNAPAMARSNKG